MTYCGRTVLLVAVGMLSTGVAKAVNSPYAEIVERNVFRLSAPVISVVAPTTKPIVLPKITLTGITTILGRRVAFITIAGVKPGEAGESFMLAEGQGVNDIEIKNIDEKAGVVSVVNHGESQVLDFDRDGAKTSELRNEPVSRESIFPHPALPPPNVQNETTLTPEEQVALIEIQRVKYQQENNPMHAILPRTEMTP
jgi:hypothetical protein